MGSGFMLGKVFAVQEFVIAWTWMNEMEHWLRKQQI